MYAVYIYMHMLIPTLRCNCRYLSHEYPIEFYSYLLCIHFDVIPSKTQILCLKILLASAYVACSILILQCYKSEWIWYKSKYIWLSNVICCSCNFILYPYSPLKHLCQFTSKVTVISLIRTLNICDIERRKMLEFYFIVKTANVFIFAENICKYFVFCILFIEYYTIIIFSVNIRMILIFGLCKNISHEKNYFWYKCIFNEIYLSLLISHVHFFELLIITYFWFYKAFIYTHFPKDAKLILNIRT